MRAAATHGLSSAKTLQFLTSATISNGHGRVQLDVQARARFERLVEDQADARRPTGRRSEH